MASPINNIPESIIEETLIQLEGNTDNPTNADTSILETVETSGFRGCNTANTNVYLRCLDVDPKSLGHTALDPLHNRAVGQSTRSNNQNIELFISDNPQHSINLYKSLNQIIIVCR